MREKASLFRRLAEYSIRFRLVGILIAVLLCTIALFNIEGVLERIKPLSEQVGKAMAAFVVCDFHTITENYGIVIAILALFVFRWIFFGFKCGLLWFFFLLFNCLLVIATGEFTDIAQILSACIFIIAVTCFFFIRSLIVKPILPLLLLAYSFSAWLLFLGVSDLAWLGLVSVFFADVFHLIFVVGYQIHKDARNRKTLLGAIVSGVRKTIPVSLLTISLLIIMDVIFCFMKLPMLASENLLHSIAIYICYAFWMPFFTAAVLSFCPLENTCEKMKKKSK